MLTSGFESQVSPAIVDCENHTTHRINLFLLNTNGVKNDVWFYRVPHIFIILQRVPQRENI
jgi:hypothetical protein